MPEGEACGDDKADENANQEEDAVRGKSDKKNSHYGDGDEERGRTTQTNT